MPTIIDSFYIQLGLEPKGFKKGLTEVNDSFAKAKDKVAKDGKDVEKSAEGMAGSLSKAASAFLELTALFLGGRGFKEAIDNIKNVDNSLGNLATSLGASPQLISALDIASKRMGGSAASTQASIQALSDSLVDLRTQGKALPPAFYQLEAQSGKQIDYLHGLPKLLSDLAVASNQLAKTDPAAANRFLRSLGLDSVTASLLIKQGPQLRSYLESMKGLTPSDADIAASHELTNSQGKLGAQFDLLAAKIMTALAPALEWLADKLGKVVEFIARWVEKNPVWVDAITFGVTVLSGSLMLGAIKNVLALTEALTGMTAVGVGGGLAALLGRLGILGVVAADGAGLADVYEHSSLNEGEDERARHERYARDPTGGATLGGRPGLGNEALRRRGHRAYHDSTNYTGSNAEVVRQAAKQLGTTPKDLATVIAYETGGTFSPAIHGGTGNRYQGLIQFGPPERQEFGANDKQTFAQQMRAVVSYLKSCGYKPGMSLMDLYSTINAGSPGHYNASDGHGTVATHVARMQVEQAQNVQRFLRAQGSSDTASPPLWAGSMAGAKSQFPQVGAATSAALNNIANDNRATTTSSSNEMHIGSVNVNAPQATDAHGISRRISESLANNMFATFANYGPN